jgi:hypothetical protein
MGPEAVRSLKKEELKTPALADSKKAQASSKSKKSGPAFSPRG